MYKYRSFYYITQSNTILFVQSLSSKTRAPKRVLLSIWEILTSDAPDLLCTDAIFSISSWSRYHSRFLIEWNNVKYIFFEWFLYHGPIWHLVTISVGFLELLPRNGTKRRPSRDKFGKVSNGMKIINNCRYIQYVISAHLPYVGVRAPR